MEQSLRAMEIGSVVVAIAMAVSLTMCTGGGKPIPPGVSSPGITIDPTGGLLTSESGGTDSFTVVLNSKPEADVTIGIFCNDTTEGTVDHSSLTFPPGNWDIPQTVTVTGIDDALFDFNKVYTVITAPAISTDLDYSNINPYDVSVTNIDDETHMMSAGNWHTVALKTNDTLWTWGDNWSSQLGDGTTDDKHTPTQISTDTNWAWVAVGGYHNLAGKIDGTLWAWGSNSYGQLGDGTTAEKNTPTQIGFDTDWVFVAAGYGHTVAVKTDGTLWAWGDNLYGQLGDGTTDDKSTPTQIGFETNWASVAAGRFPCVRIVFSWSITQMYIVLACRSMPK